MRVLVCTDTIGALASYDAGAALGRAFRAASPEVQVAVVPMAASGQALADALAHLGDDAPLVRPASGERAQLEPAGTNPLAAVLATHPRRVMVDLTDVEAQDGGAALLHDLGARADVPLDEGPLGFAALTRIDLAPARALVGDTELVVVVPAAQQGDLLLGLRGLTARRGHAAGTDPAVMLATDAALGRLAAVLGQADAPGLGAAGGMPLALVALGAEITTGPALCARAAGLARSAAQADVIVTGSDVIDFARRGGPVVEEMAALAGRVLRPCVAAGREVHVSARELRTFGIESAHALGGEPDLTGTELTRRASGMAASWTW
ncbi:glycerate kinase [Propioniciclava sp.]|uniref:glycerate kinase n=1 Tax=Propioniciclava sp. TaxID=2038686 RepID=UPI0026036259|nr:glycerate kinase [Propioniciclava sp.]